MNIKKPINRLKNIILTNYLIELNHDYKNSIFLVGSGRSGTTWVSSIINYNNDYRYVFEPFYPHENHINKSLSGRYLRIENQSPEIFNQLKCIFSGDTKTPWIDRFNKKLISNRRLIKEIRAHLLLKWIHHYFPEMPIILLLRHPCAVTNSKLAIGWGSYLKNLLKQSELVDDFLYPYKETMESLQTDFEKHMFYWCIENYVPLKQFKQGEIHLAFYENFCMSPKEEIERLFSFLGKNFDDSVFNDLNKPSAMSRKESAIITGRNVVSSWEKHLSYDQLQRADEILNLFGLDQIYSSKKVVPQLNDAYRLMTI